MYFSMITAFTDTTLGIGRNNKLLWRIPEDLKRFYELTKNTVVIMGYNTYLSLPENKRPLPERYNIVLTNKQEMLDRPIVFQNLAFCNMDTLGDKLAELGKHYTACYVIGGQSIYEAFLPKTEILHVTRIYKAFDCDKFFPTFEDRFDVQEVSGKKWSDHEKCSYRY